MFNRISETYKEIKRIWFIRKIKYPYANDLYIPEEFGNFQPKQFNRLKWKEDNEVNLARKQAIKEFSLDLKHYYKDVFVEAILNMPKKDYFGHQNNQLKNLPFNEVKKIQDAVEYMWIDEAELEDALIHLTYPQIFRVFNILVRKDFYFGRINKNPEVFSGKKHILDAEKKIDKINEENNEPK